MSASDCVLLRADALRDKIFHCNATAASAVTSRDLPIEVSLRCPERPLLPAVLFVSVPGVDFTDNPPRIVRAVDDLILIRVPLPVARFPFRDDYDFFIYRPGGEKGSSLKLLPRTIYLHDEDVGLLRRGEEHYTVAALLPGSKCDVYDLHRFDSETEKWSFFEVPLVEPQVSFPYKKIPVESQRIHFHLTSTVIPVGGEGGTMGWVDLWHSILLCDVLSTEPKLRGVPLPLPPELLRCNKGLEIDLGCPKSLRGIAYVDKPGMEPCLKLVHLGVTAVPIHIDDSQVVEQDDWEMHDWTITTWSNKKMTASWEDWHWDCEQVKASRTAISSELNSKMLKSGLLSPGGVEPEQAFQNLLVSFPALGIDDGVVYLQAKVKFWDSKVFVLALDTRDNKLLDAVEFGTERIRGTGGIVYFPSSIGRYMGPEDKRFIPEGDSNRSESSQYNKVIKLQRFRILQARIIRSVCSQVKGKFILDDDTIARGLDSLDDDTIATGLDSLDDATIAT